LREAIVGGQYLAGEFLPSVRALMASSGSASMTVRRALKLLESEGLAQAEKKGYRVLAGATDPERGCPLAYVICREQNPEQWSFFIKAIFDAFHEATARRGWSLLAQGTVGLTHEQIVEGLRGGRVCGVIMDSHDESLIAAVREAQLPMVMADAWVEGSGIDSILQDGHQAGVLAARYLAGQGCKRLGWFGTVSHYRDRFGGAVVGIASEGYEIVPELLVATEDRMEEAAKVNAAKALLSRPDRPDGIISLWRDKAMAVKRAGDELGLKQGRDYHLVGWCPEELYEQQWRAHFGDEKVAPAICWSIRTMAEIALSRLAERRANPELPPLRVCVPTWLRPGEMKGTHP
jgi:DNA-binding LacI/PurR family transcriptional regulator